MPVPLRRSAARLDEHYQFRLEFTDEDGQRLHEHRPTQAEFERAVSDTYFAAFRRGLFETFQPSQEQARIEPIFSSEGPPMRSHGFRIVIPNPHGGMFDQEFAPGYFASRAASVRAALRQQDHWPEDRSVYYGLTAYLDDAQPTSVDVLALEPPASSISVVAMTAAALGSCDAWDEPNAEDLPVYVERSIIDEAVQEAVGHPDREIGGVLIGRVCRDQSTAEVFVQVTGLVSGDGTTESTKTSVTFTVESFQKAREMIRLRRRSGMPPEIIIGWYHSHPFRFCAECPLPTPPECVRKILFFSADDVQVMEAFPQAFMVGLLVAVEPRVEKALGHAPVQLYGWRRGEVVSRGFCVYRA